MTQSYPITGGDFNSAGFASSEVKRILKKRNVNKEAIRRCVVAMYEAEVNIVAHAYMGEILVCISDDKVSFEAKDEGPGIENIEQAMERGFSTASEAVREMGFGAGMGLPNIKDNADEFSINSEVSVGTSLKVVNYLTR